MLDSIQLGPWYGGTRYDIPTEECARDELSDGQNIRLDSGGSASLRPGILSYKSEAAIGSSPTLTMVFEYDVDADTTQVVLVADAAMYKYSSGWSAITGGTTITAGDDNTFERVNANGTFVQTNGVDTDAIKYTGTGNASALDDNARFSKGKHIAWWDNRLWILNVDGATGQLWYSDTADIETYGATSFYNFGGIGLGLMPTQNSMCVHTTDGIYTLIPTGSATNPYHPQKRTDEAALDGRGIVALPGDSQLMILKDGVYEWSGGAVLRKVSLALDGEDGYWANLNPDRLHKALAMRVPKRDYVVFALPYGSSQTNMNHLMFYDYRRRTVINGEDVGIWFGPDVNFERFCGAVIDNKLHLGDDAGTLWDHEDATKSDNGGSIVSFFETGAPAPLGGDVTVGWVNGRHYYDSKGDYTLNVLQRGAEIRGEVQQLDLSGNTLTLPAAIPGYISDPGQYPQDLPLLDYSPQTSILYSMNAAGQDFTMRRCQLWYDGPSRSTKGKSTD